jgi:CBS domain-containing protein
LAAVLDIGKGGDMGLHDNMLGDPVTELTLREAIIVTADTSVRAAIERMRAERLGCAVVVGDDELPRGIFRENEVMALLARSPSSLDDPVESHLAPDWASVKETDSISKALEAMKKKGLRFVVVCNDEGRAVALTGQKGVLEYIAEHFPRHVLTQSPGAGMPDEREGA